MHIDSNNGIESTNQNQIITIAELEPGRLDAYLANYFTQYSRSFWQRAIKAHAVMVNNKNAKGSTLLKPLDTITITWHTKISSAPASSTLDFPPVFDHITVIDEQEHFIVLNKPAGIIVHKPSQYCTTLTLVDWIAAKYPLCNQIGHPERPGIVHRLDKDTSGIILVAKTHYGHFKLSELFKNRLMKKEYQAVVTGHPDHSGSINLSIGRNPIKRNQMAPNGIKARDAITTYKVLHYFANYSLLELYPETGRTHQIRVHCSAMGHGLLGDALYGIQSQLISRHALHAYKIAFNFDGIYFNYCAPLPHDMQILIAEKMIDSLS